MQTNKCIFTWQWPTQKLIGYFGHCTRLSIVFCSYFLFVLIFFFLYYMYCKLCFFSVNSVKIIKLENLTSRTIYTSASALFIHVHCLYHCDQFGWNTILPLFSAKYLCQCLINWFLEIHRINICSTVSLLLLNPACSCQSLMSTVFLILVIITLPNTFAASGSNVIPFQFLHSMRLPFLEQVYSELLNQQNVPSIFSLPLLLLLVGCLLYSLLSLFFCLVCCKVVL